MQHKTVSAANFAYKTTA